MQQEKISRAERSWANPLNALQETIHYSFIKFCIYCSPSGTNSLCTTPWESKKIINMVLLRDLWNFSFFGRGDVSPTHSEICRFVSGSQAKHQVSFSVIILLKIFLSASVIAIMSWQDVTRSSLCSGVKECGTKWAHNFLFPKSSFRIRRTTVLRDVQRFCYHSWCDSTVIFDQISNSSNVYLSSSRFWTATSLVIFYQLPSVSKSRLVRKSVWSV